MNRLTELYAKNEPAALKTEAARAELAAQAAEVAPTRRRRGKRPWVPTEHDLTPVDIGTRYLAPSGRIWTVTRVTARGGRVVLTASSPDGEIAMVVDSIALRQMIALDPARTDTQPPVEHRRSRRQRPASPQPANARPPAGPSTRHRRSGHQELSPSESSGGDRTRCPNPEGIDEHHESHDTKKEQPRA
jgi:hypothetical protein